MVRQNHLRKDDLPLLSRAEQQCTTEKGSRMYAQDFRVARTQGGGRKPWKALEVAGAAGLQKGHILTAGSGTQQEKGTPHFSRL